MSPYPYPALNTPVGAWLPKDDDSMSAAYARLAEALLELEVRIRFISATCPECARLLLVEDVLES